MIDVPRHPDFSRNMERCRAEQYPCVICGSPCPRPTGSVRLFYGDSIVTDAEADQLIADGDEGGDMGYYPIGSDCLKEHPEIRQYVKK